ncbi:MAG: hypothetical protein ACP5HU_09580 [Phycisphaerae bacterium]
MRLIALLATFVGLTTLLLSAGCAGSNGELDDPEAPRVAESDNLRLTIDVSDRQVAVGDKLTVNLTAENIGSEPVAITARSGAKMIVRIWEKTPAGWTTVKQYPEAAIMVLTPWALQAGEQKQFDMELQVDKDWPTAETIRLTAELNGRPELRAGAKIDVAPRGG